jgi:hypothetical protein
LFAKSDALKVKSFDVNGMASKVEGLSMTIGATYERLLECARFALDRYEVAALDGSKAGNPGQYMLTVIRSVAPPGRLEAEIAKAAPKHEEKEEKKESFNRLTFY